MALRYEETFTYLLDTIFIALQTTTFTTGAAIFFEHKLVNSKCNEENGDENIDMKEIPFSPSFDSLLM